MAHGKRPSGRFPFVVFAVLLLMPGWAAAQSRIAWRITIGAPPDPNVQDFTENGMLLPRGYVSGYGYYEDYIKWAPSIVITNQQPPALHDIHAASQPGHVEGGIPAMAALFRVRVPADAEIWFSGEKTAQRGSYRLFVTPEVDAGRTLAYDVRARWRQDGQEVVRKRTVTVRAGDRLTLDFLQQDEEDTVLPPPRPLEKPK
jgi:uncharacterized protein (TIGR03000 family)